MFLYIAMRANTANYKTKVPAECTYLPATVDVDVSDVGCVVLVSAYDVDIGVSNDVLIGGVVVVVAAVSTTHGSKIQKTKHAINMFMQL